MTGGKGRYLGAGLRPEMVARLAKTGAAHKYDHGHVLVLSGGAGRGGAARLAARAALRVGAGLVTIAVPGAALAEHAAQVTAIMLRVLNDAAGLRDMLKDRRLNALCLGPGLGLEASTRDLVVVALAARRRVVLDADALTAFAGSPAALFGQLHGDVVLTPHAGEFARLFPDLAPKGHPIPEGAVRLAAERCGAVVLLKGAVTRIATPDGRMAEVALTGADAAPWLATAGSGDVLAGVITGLLARGFSPIEAAQTGAGLHGAAGRALGPGLIAEDLPDALPGVFRALGV
ncbi:MAG: NAD(P)H-hydrate dehydratase [Qingshengfaniella sp.]